MPTVKHNDVTYHIREEGVFIGSGAASSTNLLDPEFLVGLELARKHHQLLLAKLHRAEMPGYVYLGYGDPSWPPNESVTYYKIGSTQNPDGRMSFGMRDILHVIRCDTRKDAFRLESFFHRLFLLKRLPWEKEWFALKDADLPKFTVFDYVPNAMLEGLIENERPDFRR